MCYRFLSALAGLYPGDAKKYKMFYIVFSIVTLVVIFFGANINTILIKIFFLVMFLSMPISAKIALSKGYETFQIKVVCFYHIIAILVILLINIGLWN